MPVRTLPAAQGDTLAPWVLRVGAPTSGRAASRTRRRPGGQCETSRRVRAARRTPAPLIPTPTSRPPGTGARPGAPGPPPPGRTPVARAAPPPAGRGRRPAGPLRAASPGRATCPPGAAPRPPAPARPGCHPAAGHPAKAPEHLPHRWPVARHPAAGRPAPAPGHLRSCPPAARRPDLAPGRPRRCRRAAALPRPGRPGRACPPRGPRRRGACPTPAAAHPRPGPPRRAFPAPSGLSPAEGHRGGGARSGVTRPCRASWGRSTPLASSPCGTARPSAPPGWA